MADEFELVPLEDDTTDFSLEPEGGFAPRRSFAKSVPGGASRLTARTPGLVQAGNIDLQKRPRVPMPDGSIATVRSMSIGTDLGEVLIPTVSDDGRLLSNDEAIEEYQRTGKHLGIFGNPESATSYAERLHEQQARDYARPRSKLADPVARTAETVSDLESALAFDPEMAQFSNLRTEEGRKGFTKAAKRLPGGIKKSIGAQATEMISGVQQWTADMDAEAYQLDYDTLLTADKDFLPPGQRRALESALAGKVRSKLDASERAAARAAAAREGAVEALPADAGDVEKAIQQGVSSAAISAPAIMVAGPVGGSMILGAGAGASRRSELLAEGVPEQDANRSALLLGSLEGLTEFIPGKALVKRVPGFWKHITEFLITEVPGENINSIAQLVDDYALELRDDVTLDDVLTTIKETTLATTAGGITQAGGAHALQALADGANARAAERAGGAPPPGPLAGPAAGVPEVAPPALPTHSDQQGGVRQPGAKIEPTLGTVPDVPRGTEPDLGIIATADFQLEPVVEERPQVAEPPAEMPVEKLGTEAPAAKISQPDPGNEREELTAVKDGQATPEQVARMESMGYVTRSETNIPRLLPAGKRRLSELTAAIPEAPAPNTAKMEKAPPRQTPTPEERAAAGKAAIERVETFGRELEAARAVTNAEPTPEQAKAGNYAKGTLRFAGLPVKLENPKGSVRKGYDDKGNVTWSRTMNADYGYIQKTEGKDGDELDVFLTGAPDTGRVFVVNQHVPQSGVFDEHKAILGAHNKAEAEKLYLSHYPRGWKGLGQIVEMSTDDFKQWVKSGDTQRPARPTQRVVRVRNVEGDLYTTQGLEQGEGPDFDLTFQKPLELRHGVPDAAVKRLVAAGFDRNAIPRDAKKVVELFVGEHREKFLAAMKAAGYDGAVYLQDGKEQYVTTGAKVEKIERKEKPKLSPTLADAKPGPAPPLRPKKTEAKFARKKLDEKAQLEQEFIGRDDDFWNVWMDEERGISEFRDTGYSGVQCTGFACAIRDKLGKDRVKIRGYEGEKNPKAEAAKDTGGDGGHDFAIVDDRFIVDPWITDVAVTSNRGVFDLKAPEDAAAIKRLYGDQSTWEDMTDRVHKAGDYIAGPFPGGGSYRTYNLEKFLEGSKVREVMYHGTREDVDVFHPGTHFGTREQASMRATGGPKRVMPVYLSIKNPLRTTDRTGWSAKIRRARADGYDGIVYLNRVEGISAEQFEAARAKLRGSETLENISDAKFRQLIPSAADSWIAFNPNQVKSATGNIGTFDERNPDIRFARREVEAGPMFFSPAIKAVEKMQQGKAGATQWWNTISNTPGIKPEELEWMGLKVWLDGHGDQKITKDSLLEFMQANQLQVREKVRSETGRRAKDSDVTAAAEWFRARGWRVWFDQDNGEQLERLVSPDNKVYWAYAVAGEEDSYGNPRPPLDELPDEEMRRRAFSLRDMAENVYSQVEGGAQYGEYTLPGGADYRELLITLPLPSWGAPGWKSVYKSSHFTGVPNIVAHVRTTERTDTDGKRMLFVEEVQSDWHQEARKHGYRTREMFERMTAFDEESKPIIEAAVAAVERNYNLGFDNNAEARGSILRHSDWKERWEVNAEDIPAIEAYRARMMERIPMKRALDNAPPDAPFKTTWPELAMKRVIRWAAEHGFERVGWTTGEQQIERYELADLVDQIEWFHADSTGKDQGITTVTVNLAHGHAITVDVDKSGTIKFADRAEDNIVGKPLREFIGDELAAKVLSKPEGTAVPEAGTTVGGDGMKEFYDRMLPRTVDKYIRKWNARVSTAHLPGGYVWRNRRGQMMGPYDEDDLSLAESDAAEAGTKIERIKQAIHSFDVTPEMVDAALGGQPLFVRRTTPIEQWELYAFAEDVKKSLGLEEFDLRSMSNGDIRLELIMVPRGGRGAGTGTAAMERLVQYADSRNARLVLSPAGKEKRADWGTTSKARLERFYRRFGFVPNKGKSQDFEIRDTMIREPNESRYARAQDQFREWFGKSKVRDARGEPLRVYHGTNQALEEFDAKRRGMATTAESAKSGFFFTDSPAIASEYAESAGKRVKADISTFEQRTEALRRQAERLEKIAQRIQTPEAWEAYYRAYEAWETMETDALQADPIEGQNIFPAYLKLENPLVHDFGGKTPGVFEGDGKTLVDLVEQAQKEGRDGLILRNLLDSPQNSAPSTHYVVFSPEQIRSAITLRRQTTRPARGLPLPEVIDFVRSAIARARLVDLPAIEVVSSYRDLDRPLRRQLEVEEATETTGAIFLPGIHGDRIILIAENNATQAEVTENLYHELVGHYGIRQIMDDARYEEVMDGIWRDMPDRVRETARRNGLDVKDVQQRRIAAEEVIAYAAGDIMSGKPLSNEARAWWKKALDAIREFFQRLLGRERFTDQAIARIVAAAKKALQDHKAGVHKSIAQGALRHQRPPLYYSGIFTAVNDARVPNIAPPAEYAKIIRSKVGKEIKPEEMEWSGVIEFLEKLTFGELLWLNDGETAGVTVPEEVRPHVERFKALISWQRKNARQDYRMRAGVNRTDAELFKAMTDAIDEAVALGIQRPVKASTFESDHVAFLNTWDQVAAQVIHMRQSDPNLAVAPKRIPKSVVLDFINREAVSVDVIPSGIEEPDLSWLDLGRHFEADDVVELDSDYVAAQVEAQIADDPQMVVDKAEELIREDPSAYLDDEDSDLVMEGAEITAEMIERARQNSNVDQDALDSVQRSIRAGIEEDYAEDPVLKYELRSEDGVFTALIQGQDSSGWSGVLKGFNGEIIRKESEHLHEVTGALRTAAKNLMPERHVTFYPGYTIPGGSDYGERLFVWNNPTEKLEGYSHGHWQQQNVLLHVRFDTRLGPKNEKILFIDEIQSDWHQEVRDRNSGPSLAEQAQQIVDDFFYQYEAKFAYHGSGRFPGPVLRLQKWLETLPISNEQFREVLLKGKEDDVAGSKPEQAHFYEWLSTSRLSDFQLYHSVKDLRRSAFGNDPDILMTLPPEVFSWKDFIEYLKRQDENHMETVRGAADPNPRNAVEKLHLFFGLQAAVGGSFAANHIGALAPSIRVAQTLIKSGDKALPMIWDSEDTQDLVSVDWQDLTVHALKLHLEQITPEMAGDEEGAEALRSIRDIGEAFREAYGRTMTSPQSLHEDLKIFHKKTSMTWTEASKKIADALLTFSRTAKGLPRITRDVEMIVRTADLEIGERASKVINFYQGSARSDERVPVPPLAKSWPLAALKWALRHAAENGFQQIALAPGSVHGTRWHATTNYARMNVYPAAIDQLETGRNAADFIDPILEARKDVEDVIRVRLFRSGMGTESSVDVWTTKARLAGWVGADAARAVWEQPERAGTSGARSLSTVAHGVGAIWGPKAMDGRTGLDINRIRDMHHGSMEIYNAIVPFMFNKFLGKYGAKIRPGAMAFPGNRSLPDQGLTGGHVFDLDLSTLRISRPEEGFVQVHDATGNRLINARDRGESDERLRGMAYEVWKLGQGSGHQIADVPVIDLNEKLKDAALNKGFPLFARRWTHGARQLGNAVNNGTNTFQSPHPSLRSRFWNYLVYKAQDKFIDLLRTQQAVAAWRGATGIPDSMDTYLQQTLYHGRVEQRTKEYEQTYVEPLVKMIKESGYDWSEVEEYLYARHAPEANARIRAINPGNPQYHSGMTDQDAQQIMGRYLSTPNFPKMQAIAAHVDAMTKFSRDTMVLEGLEDPAVVQAWEATYQAYVPLKGWAGLDIDSDMPKRGRGFDVGGKLTKMRTGRTSRAATILANIVAQAQSTIILAEKAKVGRALYDFVSATPAPDLWAVDQVEYMRYVDPNSGLVREGINPSFKLADNVLRVRRNGKDFHITFNPEDQQMVRLAAAMKNLSSDQIGPVLGLLHGVNRILSTLNTSLNPEFVITNALRDLQTALANLTEQQQKALRRRVVRDWRAAWWGIRRGERGKSAAWAREWLDFKRAGGKVGWIDHYKTPQDLEKKLRRHLSPDNVLTYTVKGLRAIGDFIENENAAVENAVRLSTYVNLKNAGVSRERAAEAAKNLTVNFNRKGEMGTVMNSLYLFYNASIQGTARLWRLAKHPKGRMVVGGFVVAGIAMDLLMRAIGGEDDDRENLYDKVPEQDKEKNIIIMIPPHLRGESSAGEKPYIKVMLPYGFNTLYYSGTKVGKYFDYGFLGNVRRVNPGEDAGRIAGSFLGAFSPIGDADGGLSQFLLPTLADPFVQLADNRSWWGGKIMPEDFDDEAPSPDSQKFFQSVPTAYKEFAAWLNDQTGGTEVSPGYVDISPETFQHWTEFAMGGAGRFGVSVINAPYKAIAEPEDLTLQEIPFWRKVVGGIGDRQTQETFYAHINEVKYVKRELDAVYKMGINTPEGEARMAYIAERYPVATKMVRSAYPNFADSRGLEDLDKDRILDRVRALTPQGPTNAEPRARVGQRKAITTTLSDARKEIRRLEARTGMPAKEREEKIREQKQLIHETLLEFNRQWNEVEDSTFGERNQGKLIEKLGPLISDRPRRQQVKSLREAGYAETADLIAALPPIPDRFAREFFTAELAREPDT